MNTVLLGELGTHARGKTLGAALGAIPGDLPPHGMAFAFGKELQQSPDTAIPWISWAREPGRVLVLMPPFSRGPCATPTSWEARRSEPLAGGESDLGRALARERQHDLRGEMLALERASGQVVTACWRQHPAAGLVVITALPLWSLLVLDHREAFERWAEALMARAGSPRVVEVPPGDTPSAFEPTSEDWTVLLHLCTGPYSNTAAALNALETSSLHRLDTERAREAIERLDSAGWVREGALTPAGGSALEQSPYRDYARALRRRHV